MDVVASICRRLVLPPYIAVAALSLCAFSPPEKSQVWELEIVRAVPGTLTIASHQTARPKGYWEQVVKPGPYPVPSVTCVNGGELKLSIEWSYERLPDRYSKLESFLKDDPLHGVVVTQRYSRDLIDDERFSTVRIRPVHRSYVVAAEFHGQMALDMIEQLSKAGITPVSIYNGSRRLDWVLDFRAAHESISKVLRYCRMPAPSQFN